MEHYLAEMKTDELWMRFGKGILAVRAAVTGLGLVWRAYAPGLPTQGCEVARAAPVYGSQPCGAL